MAFRADGRLSSRMRMWPELGAGSTVTLISGAVESAAVEVEYSLDDARIVWRVNRIGRRGGILGTVKRESENGVRWRVEGGEDLHCTYVRCKN